MTSDIAAGKTSGDRAFARGRASFAKIGGVAVDFGHASERHAIANSGDGDPVGFPRVEINK
ncbi:hypothetical protein LAV84_28920 [Rhizobium sp. VS19-DR104.2]|uniref:Uncharacterized protein n=1 Tax=Rhizobium tumorigenes TaxID=2041385 RepID=A0AAF1K8F7_9HYPH|nr:MULTISPECIES: hypothetical protein [Rhizobium]MBO9102417.1 hypothetical protein [Rhizobium sp. L58/93]MBO9172463.1 hypothetical protein [Rhizobium sp. L245/93]MBZ5763513.1 hypothetical protein [Rhizobium sp. VS19-DR96]MBZ5769422.1 hypothetical protein [Rhizobium sp. VS19-DR129.2]MBZ5776957.1 hypothetical protein [Rhizobium sp. VS19-DRK62.2]